MTDNVPSGPYWCEHLAGHAGELHQRRIGTVEADGATLDVVIEKVGSRGQPVIVIDITEMTASTIRLDLDSAVRHCEHIERALAYVGPLAELLTGPDAVGRAGRDAEFNPSSLVGLVIKILEERYGVRTQLVSETLGTAVNATADLLQALGVRPTAVPRLIALD